MGSRVRPAMHGVSHDEQRSGRRQTHGDAVEIQDALWGAFRLGRIHWGDWATARAEFAGQEKKRGSTQRGGSHQQWVDVEGSRHRSDHAMQATIRLDATVSCDSNQLAGCRGSLGTGVRSPRASGGVRAMGQHSFAGSGGWGVVV